MQVRAQSLLDELHTVMPSFPVELHDAARRREIAPAALPVMREILALHAAHPDESIFGSRVVEFEVYAAVLGDESLLQGLRERASAGDIVATAELLAVQITISSGSARQDALEQLVSVMPRLEAIEGSVVRWLDTADLSIAEANTLATTMSNEELRSMLRRSAESAAAGPRRLIGQPLELVARLVDDRPFSTTSLIGREVLVCFWASWCEPSLAALEAVRRAEVRHPGMAIVGVSCDHDLAALRNCLADHGDPSWVHFFDRSRPGWHELATACGVSSVPLTLLVDREGIVRDVVVGARIEAAVDRVFGQ